MLVHNHPPADPSARFLSVYPLTPSDADIDAAMALGRVGVGLAIIRSDASAIYVVAEPREVLSPDSAIRSWGWSGRRWTFTATRGRPRGQR
jgi:hypothetical protein